MRVEGMQSGRSPGQSGRAQRSPDRKQSRGLHDGTSPRRMPRASLKQELGHQRRRVGSVEALRAVSAPGQEREGEDAKAAPFELPLSPIRSSDGAGGADVSVRDIAGPGELFGEDDSLAYRLGVSDEVDGDPLLEDELDDLAQCDYRQTQRKRYGFEALSTGLMGSDGPFRSERRVNPGPTDQLEANESTKSLSLMTGDLTFTLRLARHVVLAYSAHHGFDSISPDEVLPQLKQQLMVVRRQVEVLEGPSARKASFLQSLESAQQRLDFLLSPESEHVSDGVKLGELRLVLELMNDVLDTREGVDTLKLRQDAQLDPEWNTHMVLYQYLHDPFAGKDVQDGGKMVKKGFVQFVMDHGLLKDSLKAQKVNGLMTLERHDALGFVATDVTRECARLVHDFFILSTGLSHKKNKRPLWNFDSVFSDMYKLQDGVDGDMVMDRLRETYHKPLGS